MDGEHKHKEETYPPHTQIHTYKQSPSWCAGPGYKILDPFPSNKRIQMKNKNTLSIWRELNIDSAFTTALPTLQRVMAGVWGTACGQHGAHGHHTGEPCLRWCYCFCLLQTPGICSLWLDRGLCRLQSINNYYFSHMWEDRISVALVIKNKYSIFLNMQQIQCNQCGHKFGTHVHAELTPNFWQQLIGKRKPLGEERLGVFEVAVFHSRDRGGMKSDWKLVPNSVILNRVTHS